MPYGGGWGEEETLTEGFQPIFFLSVLGGAEERSRGVFGGARPGGGGHPVTMATGSYCGDGHIHAEGLRARATHMYSVTGALLTVCAAAGMLASLPKLLPQLYRLGMCTRYRLSRCCCRPPGATDSSSPSSSFLQDQENSRVRRTRPAGGGAPCDGHTRARVTLPVHGHSEFCSITMKGEKGEACSV